MPEFIIFQYNPDTITRTITPKYVTKGAESKEETFQIKSAPSESISVDVEFDATDQLEQPEANPTTVHFGINPQLAALETILYPPLDQMTTNASQAEAGTTEIVPPTGPLTLFVFGASKILPVKISQYTTTEEAYDTNLNPIRAKVAIKMDVLTYTDLHQSQRAFSLYQANHISKEVLAQFTTINSDRETGVIL
jgi:hypothetical protein